MKNKRDLLDLDTDPVERCTECPHPDGCIRECIMEKYVFEDVAKIRNEENL